MKITFILSIYCFIFTLSALAGVDRFVEKGAPSQVTFEFNPNTEYIEISCLKSTDKTEIVDYDSSFNRYTPNIFVKKRVTNKQKRKLGLGHFYIGYTTSWGAHSPENDSAEALEECHEDSQEIHETIKEVVRGKGKRIQFVSVNFSENEASSKIRKDAVICFQKKAGELECGKKKVVFVQKNKQPKLK